MRVSGCVSVWLQFYFRYGLQIFFTYVHGGPFFFFASMSLTCDYLSMLVCADAFQKDDPASRGAQHCVRNRCSKRRLRAAGGGAVASFRSEAAARSNSLTCLLCGFLLGGAPCIEISGPRPDRGGQLTRPLGLFPRNNGFFCQRVSLSPRAQC